MAHHKATKKSIRQVTTKTARNYSLRTRLKNVIKSVRGADNASTEERAANFSKVQKQIDKIAAKNLITKRTASRLKSRLNAFNKKAAA